MTLEIQYANGDRHELDNTAVGNTIRTWWDGSAMDLTERGYPGAYLVDVAPPPAPPPSVPQTVTPRQARLALLAAGLLDAVNAAVEAAGPQAKIDWEFALEIHRDNALIASMAAGLNLTSAQIDGLFFAAAIL